MSMNNNQTNSNRFISSFNKIEGFLRRQVDDERRTGFYSLVDLVGRTDSKVRTYTNDLKQFASLRNAIVHSQQGEMIIAEPNDWSVNRIERICEVLLNPPLIIPKFSRDVLKMDVNNSIGEAVTVMYSQEYSQIPVYEGDLFQDLLTANTVARWLGAVVADDVFSLKENLIRDVLVYSEPPATFSFMGRGMNIYDVMQTFTEYSREAKKLDAILITENGRKEEKLLGIITIFDIVEIQNLL